jgi:hypothetical protein
MKKLFYLIGIAAFFSACNTKETDKENSNIDSSNLGVKRDSAEVISDLHYFWTSDFDPKKGMVMKKTTPVSKDSLTTENMINMLNGYYPEIKLEFSRISNDSIYLKIKKSTYLTQQMGSSGAEAYLAEVTYNLTEVNGISYVNIAFRPGDHAVPGTYSRTDFIQVTE